ncbi:MAG: radical SAM/SPASM domain-containing protein [Beijerinckiaceae bacterium]
MSEKIAYSQLRAAPRQNLRDIVPLRAPFTLYVETTNICNFNCVYCPESFEDFEAKSGGMFRMDFAAFTRVADQIADMGGVKALNLYMMGEPFVNRGLPDFIRIAREKGIANRIAVTSNASLINETIARQVIEAGLDYLRVSVYGGTSEAHARKTQSKVPFDRIWRNVKTFRDTRDAIGGATQVYVKMIDSGVKEENEAFLRTFGPVADEAHIEPAMNWNDPDEGVLAQIDRSAMLETDHFRNRKDVCPFPFYSLVIHSDLRVSVCCVDWAKQAVVGDLSKQTLAEVWRGQALRDFQTAHLEGRRRELTACRNCTFLHTAPDNLDGLTVAEFAQRFADA